MALQFSVDVRNARLDAIEDTIGTTPVLELRTGSPPANCAAADSGTLLSSTTLPGNWMDDAASGVKVKAGSWAGAATAAGTVGHFRIKQGSACKMQGTVTETGGGGDAIITDATLEVDQDVDVVTFQLTEGGA